MTETQDKAWQRGYPLPLLKQLADVFRATDKGLVLGAFTGYKERDVATALAQEQLMIWWSSGRSTPEGGGTPVAALVWRRVKTRQGVKDFTGQVRAHMEPGDIHVSRVGFLPGEEECGRTLLEKLIRENVRAGEAVFVSIWQENPDHQELLTAFPFRQVAVKIPASSELIGVYAMGRQRKVEAVPLPEAETWGLRQLQTPPLHMALVPNALERLPAYADHYSSYNKGHAWSALALRGYGGDPDFIIKPAEMSKAWKQDHPTEMGWVVSDTPLRAALPELEQLIRLVPGKHQRIRLMRLNPGGGELTRHADITDPEAGTQAGKVLRIHIPLLTNPGVVFSSWELGGRRYERHMGVGEVWYLDTRKPHTAVNGGDSERVHLVIDAFSSPELLGMLERGQQ